MNQPSPVLCSRLSPFLCRVCFPALFFLLGACVKKDHPAPESKAVVYTDVAYGNDPSQKIDLYLPAGRSMATTPLLVLFHGGAWITGDKADFAPYIDSLQDILPSYAIANVNYRLASIGVNLFPTQESDADSAVQYLQRHTKDYRISDRFIFLGASAGGQMALIQAYKYHVPRAAAVISFFGPTDMQDLAVHSPDAAVVQFLPLLMGGTPAQNPELYFSTSPVHFVTDATCPTLLFQGGADQLVPFREAFELQDSLKMHGVVNQLVFYPDQGHGWTGPDLADSFDKILSFLKTNKH